MVLGHWNKQETFGEPQVLDAHCVHWLKSHLCIHLISVWVRLRTKERWF
jgi:hypothetical protein